MSTQCDGIGRETCRRRCKPAAIRTLAYVVTECREDGAGMVVYHQALRIRRGDREPITGVDFPPSGPMPDPQGLCRLYGGTRQGNQSVVWFPLQRLGVSPDGSGVVFEVNTEFSSQPPTPFAPLSAEQEGMFFVRSDGSGMRRLGPASHAMSFSPALFASPPIAFSPNGRRIAFTDLGKGTDGKNAVQIVVLDLATGERTQVTHLPSDAAPDPKFFVTCCPKFIDDKTVVFQTFVDPDGSNPEHDLIAATVRIDGSRFTRLPTPVAGPGSRLVPSFEIAGPHGADLLRMALPGTPVKPYRTTPFPVVEVFLQRGKNLLQLTNFHANDTIAAFLSARRAFFIASADPVGENPYENCQMFSTDTHGGGLRQVTHFNPGKFVDLPGCSGPEAGPPGCSIGNGYYRVIVEDPVTKAVVFNSSCNPFGANPTFGDQLFAMRPDGSGLRQLTDAPGFTTGADGSFRVELSGPFAYSAPLR
jgi:hypothetical protein